MYSGFDLYFQTRFCSKSAGINRKQLNVSNSLFKYLIAPPLGTCDWLDGFAGPLPLADGDIAGEAAAREDEVTFRSIGDHWTGPFYG